MFKLKAPVKLFGSECCMHSGWGNENDKRKEVKTITVMIGQLEFLSM